MHNILKSVYDTISNFCDTLVGGLPEIRNVQHQAWVYVVLLPSANGQYMYLYDTCVGGSKHILYAIERAYGRLCSKHGR